MTDLLSGLNAAQRQAVTETEGFVRVIAGAGSGKTRALSHRFAFLVNELGILPGNILCVTFTNKSANEMRQRIHILTGDNDTGYINTFHGFCVSVLQEDSSAPKTLTRSSRTRAPSSRSTSRCPSSWSAAAERITASSCQPFTSVNQAASSQKPPEIRIRSRQRDIVDGI